MQTPREILADLWKLAGGDISALDAVTLTGKEPQLPSSFRVAAAAQASIAAAGIDGDPWNRRQIGTRDQQHIGAVHRERAACDRTRNDPRQIEHAHARERTITGRPRFWRRIADLFDRKRWQLRKRPGVWRRRPFVMRTHQRHHSTAGIGRGLERFAVPSHQGGLDIVALRLASEDLAHGRAMMGEVPAQPAEKRPGIPHWAALVAPRWWPLAAGTSLIALVTTGVMLAAGHSPLPQIGRASCRERV